jgi:hypothetical protein
MTSIDLALSLAARGWPVFPVGKNKRPIIGEWTVRATRDEAKAREMFAPYPACAAGVLCGLPSRLFVVDVDNADAGHPIHARMEPTLVVGTPRGGYHYYFTIPDDVDDVEAEEVLRNTQKAEACLGYPDVDTRGCGGYVVGPGSATNGGRYEILVDVDPAPIPSWIVDAMRAYKRRKAAAVSAPQLRAPTAFVDSGAAYDRARRYVERMPPAISGSGGHVATMKVARACATGFGLGEGDVLALLREYNARCSPPWSEKELAHKAREATNKPDPKGNTPGHLLKRASTDVMPGVVFTGQEALAVRTTVAAEVVEAVEGEVVDEATEAAEARAFVRLPEPDDEAQWEMLDEIKALGGLCETFLSWVMAGADYPQPGLAVGATIALGAALGQRRWTYDRATSSNIICAVAPTASGKGRPQGALGQVLRELWPTAIGANDLSSTTSTIGRIEESTKHGVGLLLVLDEYGPRLKALFDARASHQRDMRALLLALTTINTGSYVAATSSTKGGQDRIIRAPGLTIFGSSTPAALHDAVGQMAIDDGFLGRHLWVEGLATLPKRQRAAPGSGAIPRAVVDAVQACRESHEAWHRGHPELGDAAKGDRLAMYVPEEVEDAGGADLLASYAEHCDERRRAPQEGDVPAALLGRCAEHATRAALALAILRCEWPAWPTVTAQVARAAIRVVEASAWTIARSLRDHRAPAWDDIAGRVAYVESAMRRIADDDGWVSRSALLRGCRNIDADALDRTLARLIDEGSVRAEKTPSKMAGRPSTRLRLA